MTTLMTNTIYTLVRKGFTVHHAATAREAADLVMNLIPEGASVGFGGSVTVRDMGLYEALKETGRIPHWHWKNDEPKPDVFASALNSAVYLTSTNAITADGCLVNIDGTGNRVGAMIHGPQQVIVIAGSNKLVAGGTPQAIARIKSVACPKNAQRLGLNTPCGLTGKCNAEACEKGMCNVTSIIERPVGGHKITIVLVDEELGY
ncbi:MAG: lactate utilization protein [Clostridia bacterium]|nr:lactate utilization protein [Clostridia bacterium]